MSILADHGEMVSGWPPFFGAAAGVLADEWGKSSTASRPFASRRPLAPRTHCR